MKSIIVPTDFSEQAENAMELALQVARKGDSKITLLHVIDHPSPSTFNTMGIAQTDYDPMENLYIMKLMEAAKGKLEDTVHREDLKDVNLNYELVIGKPYTEIEKYITSLSADLVVMGTSGASGFDGLLLGSNAERVIRNAQCPVISCKAKVDLGKIKNIVFASDFVGNKMDKLIGKIKELQEFLGAKLSMVRINTPNSFTSTRHDHKLMKEFADKHQLENYTLDIYNYSTEEEGIMYFADDIDADLIALGTHGRKGIWNLVSGSIAEDVVNHARRPVWTYKLY